MSHKQVWCLTLMFVKGNDSAVFRTAEIYGVPYGIRTRVAAVKGRCPRPLDEGVVVGEAEIYGDAPPPSSRMNRKNSD